MAIEDPPQTVTLDHKMEAPSMQKEIYISLALVTN
ncbi:predicted protein [Plenodomus lingam JN3]|uniref:Predicted protein n=1 Tax=Leptosphaeria maculans (strain JN3 / isolate v23.1.3 / race Av1-4-5-6-7-8) TaxID=985895 RepID=E5R440_LEPMJ|nr:predicted protein [Plenodomus lingam JN3]CBX91817.1 predicted protein [Plenodomus lingam JN3]